MLGTTRFLLLSLFMLILCGCGKSTHSVSRHVVFSNGKPAHVGTVVIFTSSDGMRSGYGVVTGSEGEFSDVTYEEAVDGLPANAYSVVVRPLDRMAVSEEIAKTAPSNFGIDYKYRVVESSGFHLDLESDVEAFTLTLEPAKSTGVQASEASFLEFAKESDREAEQDR